MSAKTILITGSTDGIGKATARELLAHGHRVVLHGRNEGKGQKVIKELAQETGHEPSRYFNADLSSQNSIHRLADELAAFFPLLDVLMNNAGTYQPERHVTEEGAELTFAVNYLAPFMLTLLLRDTLQKSASARVVNVASTAHRDVYRLEWENL